MRLRPAQHIRRQGDIRAVRQQGGRLDCGAFTVWWKARTEGTALPRACFVASIQAVGPAVLRNRAKRRMRENFRRHQKLLPPTCDLLVVARAAVNRWPFARLETAFTDACGRMVSNPSSPNP